MAGTAPATPLHRQRQTFEFPLDDLHRASRTFNATDCVNGSLRRYSVASPHEKDLQKFGGLTTVQTGLQ